MNSHVSRLRGVASLAAVVISACVCAMTVRAQDPFSRQALGLEEHLRRRVQSRPHDAAGWRMLGHVLLEKGELLQARRALERAVELDPLCAAAHFDLARALLRLSGRENEIAAARHLHRVVTLAAESEYARDARTLLAGLPVDIARSGEIVQAGYEIKRFDGSEPDLPGERSPEELFPPAEPLWFRVETGLLYNSNVALAPISRALAPGTRASFQGFLAPEVEWRALEKGGWRAGPSFGGNFTLNEGNFRNFNLESYRPGAFLERTIHTPVATWLPRLQYEFTHDEFDGTTFGNRHALTASAAALWNGRDLSVLYWMIDHTDFRRDGALPSLTSADGWTNTLGFSHDFLLDRRHLRLVRLGLDLQRADTTGDIFRYNGISLYSEVQMPLGEGLLLTLTGGWGYRDYFDFDFSPSRNENIWRAGSELRKQINEYLALAAVFNYDRFDSDNRLFDAERFIGGVMLIFER